MSFLLGMKKLAANVMGSTGAIELTVDKEYDALSSRYSKQKGRVSGVTKNIKGMCDHLDGFSSCMTKVFKDLKQIYPEGTKSAAQFSQLEVMSAEFNKKTKEFKKSLTQKVKERVEECSGQFSRVGKLMNGRDEKKIAFDKLRAHVKKVSAKPPPEDPHYVPKKKDELKWVKKSYEEAAQAAKKGMSLLLDDMGAYYEPAIQVLCTDTIDFSVQMKKSFEKMHSVTSTFAPKKISSPPLEKSKKIPPPPMKKGGKTKAPPSGGKKAAFEKKFGKSEWYYLDGDVNQKGPFKFDQMKKLFKQGKLGSDTHIFGGDLADWKPVKGVDGMLLALK